MTNTRVSAALDALKPAVLNRDGEAAARIIADLAETDPQAAALIRAEYIARGLRNMVYGRPADGP